MVLPQGTKAKAGINVRPGAKEFISRMAQLYEVVVFTASHSCYGKAVVELLDPGKVVRACLFRENCWLAEEGFYVKDLRVVGGRNLEDIVLVDNAAYSYGFQLDNAVPILNYYSGEEDRELASL
jgi:CTD small phosphatase-like protein 2